MSVSEWKEINLFRIVPSGNNINLSNIKGVITTHCYNSTSKVFCDNLGWVYVYCQNWDCEYFKVEDSAILLCAISQENILVTLTQDGQHVHLKLFNINNSTKSTGGLCIAYGKLEVSSFISALNIFQLDTQCCISLGSEKGEVYLFRNVMNRDISTSFRCILLIHRPITGIQFKKNGKNTCNMFVSSDSGIFCFTITENNNVGDTKIILDNKQESSRCCGMSRTNSGDDNYFIIGRDDAVYCFTSDGRGPCYPFKGLKRVIQFSSRFLIMVMWKENPTILNKSSTIVIIDIFNKIIVLNKEMEPIIDIIIQPQTCYLITESCKVFILSELDLRSRLRILISKHLYDIAIRHLQEAGKDINEIGTVYLEYGDYLLNNGDLKSAIDMYIKTINTVSPYHIIEKLLDSRYNEYLAKYLEALTKREHNEEYNKLFSNCNERLNLIWKIENIYCNEYLKNDELKKKIDPQKQKIHTDTTNTNFTIQTLTMFFHSDQQINSDSILLCNEDEIYNFCSNNSEKLMQEYPEKVATILKILCINNKCTIIPERVLPLLLSNKNSCIIFLEEIIQNVPEFCRRSLYHVLFQMYLEKWRNENCKNSDKIIAFLKDFEKVVNIEHILILCGFYKFWDGILNFHEIFKNNDLYVKHFIKNCKSYSQLIQCEENIDVEMWIKTIGVNTLNEKTLKMLNLRMDNAISERNKPLLQVLKNMVSNESILVSHIKEFFSQDYIQSLTDYKCTNSLKISNEMNRIQYLLENYIHNPIEFRSSNCDKCKKTLKLPVVYFLCQHSFHKQCISAYSHRISCISCTAIDLSNSKLFNDFKDSVNKNVCNSMNSVSSILGSGIFKNVFKKKKIHSICRQQEKYDLIGNCVSNHINSFENNYRDSFNPFEEEGSNPFEDELNIEHSINNPLGEYDSNLNPFTV